MKLINGGTIGASIPQAGKSIDVDPQGCIRIEMAKKHTHNDVILTDDEAVEFCREVMNLLKLKERAAYAETKRAVQEIADSIAAEDEYQSASDDYGVYTEFSDGEVIDAEFNIVDVVEPANETA